MIVLYGILNCDTVKKARKWLEIQGMEYTFHDFRVDGLDEKLLQGWLGKISLADLINRRSTTWRQLGDDQRSLLEDGRGLDIIVQNPTLIKRPVLEKDGALVSVGFKEPTYNMLFK